MKMVIIIGTRPEAIKLIPIIQELRQHKEFDLSICNSGQHREIVEQTLNKFGIKTDAEFNIFQSGLTLSATVSNIMVQLEPFLEKEKPDWVIVQGDTSTAIAGALAGIYSGCKIAHIEAGLRSHDVNSPFPEEINRRLIARLANLHFAPDLIAKENLIQEGVSSEDITVIGNPGLDLLVNLLHQERDETSDLLSNDSKPILLVTVHRRENIGKNLENICSAIRRISQINNPEVNIVFPVHPNPAIQKIVFSNLGGLSNVLLTDPLEYCDFVELIIKSSIILSDSGGIQEEATFLGKPLLILRDKTERFIPDTTQFVRLVDSSETDIVENTADFLAQYINHRSHKKNLKNYKRAAPLVVEKFLKLAHIHS